MKRLAILALCLMMGCKAATTTTAPSALAPGYTSQWDQTTGQTLSSLHAFALKASADYATLTPTQQAMERNALDAFIAAVNTADAMYMAFHQGTQTQATVQASIKAAINAQSAYTSVGVSK
ncbi:MAG: hypothetical protein KGL39_30495 [Patescibacteria group bacterium]|nr:hypothetical protein [Patescibacteria group bacterium]